MVFSLGVTTTVGMTQDWALGHSRPWGLILTVLPGRLIPGPAGPAAWGWGEQVEGPRGLKEGQ